MDRYEVVPALFSVPKAVIGVIHVGALPGTPEHRQGVEAIAEVAAEEALQYEAAGFHGLMIENMHDRPYLRGGVGPEVVAAMTAVGREVRRAVGLPLGVQVLAAANREALAVAKACRASFVRVEGFVFGHVADEGWIDSDAGELLRYRRAIDAEEVRIFADVKKKHSSHAATSDVDLAETARAAEFFLADGVIVTGNATGEPADPEDVASVSEALSLPTLVGSGITPTNLSLYRTADAWIVGSALKRDGLWSRPLEAARLAALMQAYADLV